MSSVDEYDNYDLRVYNELFRKEAALRISDLEARGIDGGGGGSGSGMSTASTQERENRGRELERDRDQDSMSMTGTSLGGTVSHQHRDTSDGDDGEDSQLRAPPRAHLRLSIHVTKSIHVTRSPPSNSATSCDKLDDAADMQGNGNQIWGELCGEQPGEMEMGAAFSRFRPSSGGDPRCAPPREIAGRSGDQIETVQRDSQHPMVSAP